MCSPTNLGCTAVLPSYTCDLIRCWPLPVTADPLLTIIDVVGDLYPTTTDYMYPASFTYQCVHV